MPLEESRNIHDNPEFNGPTQAFPAQANALPCLTFDTSGPAEGGST
jgi:hypothetical protein